MHDNVLILLEWYGRLAVKCSRMMAESKKKQVCYASRVMRFDRLGFPFLSFFELPSTHFLVIKFLFY